LLASYKNTKEKIDAVSAKSQARAANGNRKRALSGIATTCFSSCIENNAPYLPGKAKSPNYWLTKKPSGGIRTSHAPSTKSKTNTDKGIKKT
jgi:hypothetical protein